LEGWWVRNQSCETSVFSFFIWNFAKKFGPEKYDFDLYKGFSMKKKGPKSPDFEIYINKFQIFTFL
jgi:hypothetical protein